MSAKNCTSFSISYFKVEDGVGGAWQLGQVVSVVAHLGVVVVEGADLGIEVTA